MRQKSLRLKLSEIWQSFWIYFIAGFICASILSFRVHNLVPGFSNSEIAAINASQTSEAIQKNPVYLPHKSGQWLLQALNHDGQFAMRGISILIGLISIGLFYYIVKNWHTTQIALFGTALLVCSSWFLHFARLATPTIMQISLLAAFAYGTWIRSNNKLGLSAIVGSVLLATLLYVPGMIWFILAIIIWQHKSIQNIFKDSPMWSILASILFLGLITPLVIGFTINPYQVAHNITGIPSFDIGLLWNFPKNVLRSIIEIIFRGPNNPEVWLKNVPFLDVFVITMCLLGLYAYILRRSLDRSKMLIGSLVIGLGLVGLGGSVAIIVLLPCLYLLATAGISLLIQQWLTVFPRNPLANRVGTILITCGVLASCFYQLNHYFIAWPNAPITKQTFNLQR